MDVRVSTQSTDLEALRSLRDWLLNEPAIRRHGRPASGGSPRPDELGVVLDWLSFAVGTGLTTAQLVLAITAWRASRPRPPAITIKTPTVTVTLDSADPEAVSGIISTLDED